MTTQGSEQAQGYGGSAGAGYACHVFRAGDIFVQSGANLGDPINDADEVCAGDVYTLAVDAEAVRLVLDPDSHEGRLHVAECSGLGAPGDPVILSSRLTLMSPDGDAIEVLMLRHQPRQGAADAGAGTRAPPDLFALPLSPMAPRVEYTLLVADSNPGTARLADIICISFGRGVTITLADGRQLPIERLKPGMRVLTRDHGGQPLRWMGRATLRAVGAYAPVVITAGAMGNSGDLVVGQHHRMFIYQRGDKRLTATAELLVQAKHLVDGQTIFLREGGFVDYFSLVFDRHEIIYAEGIPAESLMVNDATLTHLPTELAEEVRSRFPGLSQNQHFGSEAARDHLDGPGPQGLLPGKRRHG